MKPRPLAVACFAAAAALVAWTAARARSDDARPRSIAELLLGPVVDLAATLEWVRFDDALRAGRPELAEQRAELALDLAPGDADAWNYYAQHLIYDRASPLREPDAAARERWVRAGLDVLGRGERESRDPGRVAFQRGVVYLALAQLFDANRPLPITRAEAWLEAAAAFDRAASAGEPLAAQMARLARQQAAAEQDRRGQ